jgi:hypothetical protein
LPPAGRNLRLARDLQPLAVRKAVCLALAREGQVGKNYNPLPQAYKTLLAGLAPDEPVAQRHVFDW